MIKKNLLVVYQEAGYVFIKLLSNLDEELFNKFLEAHSRYLDICDKRTNENENLFALYNYIHSLDENGNPLSKENDVCDIKEVFNDFKNVDALINFCCDC